MCYTIQVEHQGITYSAAFHELSEDFGKNVPPKYLAWKEEKIQQVALAIIQTLIAKEVAIPNTGICLDLLDTPNSGGRFIAPGHVWHGRKLEDITIPAACTRGIFTKYLNPKDLQVELAKRDRETYDPSASHYNFRDLLRTYQYFTRVVLISKTHAIQA